MKNRRWADWTPVLCIVLLAAVIFQGLELRSLRRQLDEQTVLQRHMEQLAANQESQLAELRQTAEEQQPLVTSYQLAVAGLDTAERTVTLRVEAELSTREEYAPVYLTARGVRVWMEGREDGTYTGEITLPVDSDGMNLLIGATDGGVSRTETLRGVSSVMELLPVQMGRFVGDSLYNYEGKGMYFTEWEVALLDLRGGSPAVTGGEYRLYRNGKSVFSGPAGQMESYSSYESGLEGRCFPCVPGDKMELRFACVDEYGLGYEFPLNWWSVTARGVEQHWPTSAYPTLTWPE